MANASQMVFDVINSKGSDITKKLLTGAITHTNLQIDIDIFRDNNDLYVALELVDKQ